MNLKQLVQLEKEKRQAAQLQLGQLLAVQFDFRHKIKRSVVHQFAAVAAGRSINNAFCLYVTACLERVGVLPIMTQHNRYYRHKDWHKKKVIPCMISK